MTKNMGSVDRTLRLLVVAFVALLFFTDRVSGALAIVLAMVAAIFFVTGVIGWCPLYSLVGLSTRKGGPTSPAKP